MSGAHVCQGAGVHVRELFGLSPRGLGWWNQSISVNFKFLALFSVSPSAAASPASQLDQKRLRTLVTATATTATTRLNAVSVLADTLECVFDLVSVSSRRGNRTGRSCRWRRRWSLPGLWSRSPTRFLTVLSWPAYALVGASTPHASFRPPVAVLDCLLLPSLTTDSSTSVPFFVRRDRGDATA